MKITDSIIIFAVLTCAPIVGFAQYGSHKSESIDGINYSYDKHFEFDITPAAIKPAAHSDELLKIDQEHNSAHAENFYYRACLLWAANSNEQRAELWENLNAWQQCEIDEFPQERVAQKLREFGSVLEQVHKATRRHRCEWDFDLENMDFSQYVTMNLQELNTLRSISHLIRLRTRLEISRGKFQNAEESINEHIKMGTDVGKIPFLTAGIVAESILSSALQSSIELSSQTGAPNQYHSLQSIPNPAVEFYSMVRTESYLIGKSFPFLYSPEKLDLTNEEWRKMFSDALVQIDIATSQQAEQEAERNSRAALILARLYPIAKRELLQAGWDEKNVNAMPVGQVVAIQTRRVWDQYADLHTSKHSFTPSVAADVHRRQIEKIETEGYDVPGQRGDFPITDLAPPVLDLEILPSRTRLINRQIAMLQVVAKIRDFAAEQKRLPDQKEYSTLDLIHDPRTGKPFEYKKTSESSVELQTEPYSHPNNPSYRKINILMKIHLRK